MTDEARNQRHHTRMKRKKEVIDHRIRQATEEKGVVVLLKGTGKGKSSSAFGMVARALGHDLKVGVVQFIKGKWQTGEEKFFANLPGVLFEVMGSGFTWDTQNREQDIQASLRTWSRAERMLADPSLSLVVLDEITYLFQYDYLPLERLLQALAERPPMQSVVITGRPCPNALEEIADTVSEINNVRHAFNAGIKAQAGVDW